ncbi:SCP2 domain-containing protein [Photobacterium sp. 1_MG-2023]|uniref:ubiquinone anaerobic biosynthesis accessory factor UbiT n=1 Tax=Photobacterium sp. 1_MG-2023 TaxID=3062646 RepID=UPI0026E28FA0|nr:SCP2 sterol-binding domain-containing protein [Photobacterium sp. 1_MG-2023]MDO6704727.1 SCP2 sterol-binding domain-containing protein [Photobacterium sp. 1_MG-2023]
MTLNPLNLMYRIAPRLLSLHCRVAPFALHQTCLEPVLRRIFADALAAGELDFLTDRTVTLAIPDIQWQFTLTLRDEKLCMLPAVTEPDAVMRADSTDLLQIAARQVDPDTLFFQRRLSMEGDTELGLAVKNLIDSLEAETLPKPMLRALEIAASGMSQPG